MRALVGETPVCVHAFTLENEGAMQLAYLLPDEVARPGAALTLSNDGSGPVSVDAVQVEAYGDGPLLHIGATAWGDGWGRFPESVTRALNVSRVDGHFAWEKPEVFAKKIDPICARGSAPVVLLNGPGAGDSINKTANGPPKPEFWEATLSDMVRRYGESDTA